MERTLTTKGTWPYYCGKAGLHRSSYAMLKQAVGRVLFILGTIGLLLNLITWLPVGINLVMMVVISIVCLLLVWGGGKMSLSKVEIQTEPRGEYDPRAQQVQGMRQGNMCPRCGSLCALGQRFCGGCGAGLASGCPSCGVTVDPASRFCANCGARLV